MIRIVLPGPCVVAENAALSVTPVAVVVTATRSERHRSPLACISTREGHPGSKLPAAAVSDPVVLTSQCIVRK